MKKRVVYFFVFVLLVSFACSTVFADEEQYMKNVPMVDNQKVVLNLDNSPIRWPSNIHDLGYDRENGHLYIIVNPEWATAGFMSQFVYDLAEKKAVEAQYPLISGMNRAGIEFEENCVWSLDRTGNRDFVQLNDFERAPFLSPATVEAKGFAIQGEKVLYYLGCKETNNFLLWSIDSLANPDTGEQEYTVEYEKTINIDLEYVKSYDLSPDGTKLICAGSEEYDKDGEEYEKNYLVQVDLTGEGSERRDLISDLPLKYIDNDEYYNDVYDLYATDDYIVVLYKNAAEFKGYIERFSYEGEPIDRVETNYCVRRITEGPNGSTLYIQRRYSEGEAEGGLEVVQVDWKNREKVSQTSRPRPLVQERTRAGETIARFDNHRFGLLRKENLETNRYDYRVPIRSKEDRVRLQIPYEDIKEKYKDGPHDLIIEYKNEEVRLSFNIEDFEFASEALGSSEDASIEILMILDDNGNVITSIEMFVKYWVNSTTSAVKRLHL